MTTPTASPLSTTTTMTMTCGQRFMAELKCPMFGLQEPQDPSKTIDVVRTFQPQSRRSAFIKLFFLCFGVGSLVQFLWTEEHKTFFFAFVSNWSYLVVLVYFSLSCLWIVVTPPATPEENAGLFRFVQWTWILYSLSLSIEIAVAILFWALDYDPDKTITYGTVVLHGVMVLLLIVDGVLLNRTPVRFRQCIAVTVYTLTYTLFTVLHGLTNMGNPKRHDNDPETDDDALYTVVSWNHRPVQAIIFSIILVLLGPPLMFTITWSLSAMGNIGCCRFDGSRRRYLPAIPEDQPSSSFLHTNDDDKEQAKHAEDVEQPYIDTNPPSAVA